MSKNINKYKAPKIKFWDGTPVHSSLDFLMGDSITKTLVAMGFDAEHRAWWSYEDLKNGKMAYVTHTRRLATVYPDTASMRDAQAIKLNAFDGKGPSNIALRVSAHGHSTAGTRSNDTVKVLNLPAFTTFIEYPKACANFAQYQPDIGAYFIIVTKSGHVKLQEWIYPTFAFDYNRNIIYDNENNSGRLYAPLDKIILDTSFKELIKDAKLVVACIADLHCGEVQAIAPPQYEFNGAIRQVNQTLANKRLYEYWLKFAEAVKLIKPHELWIVGDVLAGTNVFEKTRRVLTSQLNEQAAMFAELMKEFLP